MGSMRKKTSHLLKKIRIEKSEKTEKSSRNRYVAEDELKEIVDQVKIKKIQNLHCHRFDCGGR